MTQRTAGRSHFRLVDAAAPLGLALAVACASLWMPFALAAVPAAEAVVEQKAFRTPEEAVEALVSAAEKYDVTALKEIFGPDGVDLVVRAGEIVSVAGVQGNGSCVTTPAISADGRFVAFHSEASNLVSGDTNGVSDIFVHDRQNGRTTRASVATNGSEANGSSRYPNLSSDGRYVTFASGASLALALPDVPVRFRDSATGLAVQPRFVIPAGDPNAEVKAVAEIRQDTLLTSLTPHMHVRGKDMTYIAHLPDGTSETLLSVPKYDFNWQHEYVFATPLILPAGTKLNAKAWYDNSAANKSNPDPKKDVWWGDQTWEEMMIGFFGTLRELPKGSTSTGTGSVTNPTFFAPDFCSSTMPSTTRP